MRFEAEMIPLAIGQRVSVLVTPREDIDTDEFDWALMANMDPEMFDEVSLLRALCQRRYLFLGSDT